MTDSAATEPTEHPALAPGLAIGVLLGIVGVLAGYVGLSHLLRIDTLFAGAFFIFFWVGVEKAAAKTFLPTLVGAAGGIVNSGMLHPQLATAVGIDPGLTALIGLVVLLLAIYLLLIQKASILFNHAYMLFFTVGAIPMLSDMKIFQDMAASIALAAAYVGLIFWGLRWLEARKR